MDLMNNVFGNYLCSIVIVFIDDIFLYSKSEDEHMCHLRIILELLKEHQLFAFLGYIVSCEVIDVDPRVTKVV